MMFDDELINILAKYRNIDHTDVQYIYNDLCDIIASLKNIQINVASNLFQITSSDDLSNSDDVLADIRTISDHIKYLRSITYIDGKKDIDDREELIDKIHDLSVLCGFILFNKTIFYKFIKKNIFDIIKIPIRNSYQLYFMFFAISCFNIIFYLSSFKPF